MSTPINDGGPAFPCQPLDAQGNPCNAAQDGMSLRAYIASRAMQAIIGITTSGDAAEYKPDDLQAATARAACGYADALIAALGKEGK